MTRRAGVLAGVLVVTAAACSGSSSSTREPPATTGAPSTTATTTVTTAPARPPTIGELLGRRVVLAHAGGDDDYPHSTPFAFGQSAKAGVDVLDLDVRLSGDGVLIVHHDDDVDRTTNGTGSVASMTYAQLHALDNAYWFNTVCNTCKNRPESDYVWRGVRTGYLLWVWPNGGAYENADGYARLFALGVDGVNASQPAAGVAAKSAA